MSSTRLLFLGAALGALLSLPVAASAAHVKPGLWEMKVQTGQAHAMPDMSKLPPAVQAQMKARGVQMSAGGGIVARHCITPADANMDKPHVGQSKDCHVENAKFAGSSYSADMVCTGEMKMRGHVQFTFESQEHYFGTTAMRGMMEGRPIANTTKIDARWLASDCGKLK